MHFFKVSVIHAALIAHATDVYNSALVLEDDVDFKNDEWPQSSLANFQEFLTSGSWDLLRLAFDYMPDTDGASPACREDCKCHTEWDARWCTMVTNGCDMRNSAAYAVSRQGYATYLELAMPATPKDRRAN